MRKRGRGSSAATCVVVLLAVYPSGARGEPPATPLAAGSESRFALPLELAQGAAWSDERPSPGYVFTPRLLPGIADPHFGFHAVLAVPYRNPGWDAAAGARAELRVVPIFEGVSGIRLVAEGDYLFAES